MEPPTACSQPDSDVEICSNDISRQEDRIDVTKELNRSGRPVWAASLGVATQPAPLTSASLLLRKYVADFEKQPLRFLQCKARNISSLDGAVARVLTGQITIEQVNRHHVSKSSVKKCMTRLKNGLATPGRKPTLPRSVEEAIVTYVDDHTNAGMARYREDVWDKAEQLAREAKVKFTASWSWWRRFRCRFPTNVPRMKEAIKLERLRAENPEYVREWLKWLPNHHPGKRYNLPGATRDN